MASILEALFRYDSLWTEEMVNSRAVRNPMDFLHQPPQ
ncbi:hypothetical protein B4168_2390 [Anoxybacillus flavithermus]|nr:hypothetical protein B4168_2390 [Anoxybacillus flavithermus]